MQSDYLKEGKWFCAIEGIAVVDRIYDIYFEEYDHIPQNKRIGDLKMQVVQYRLFCDFDGKPIKRNRFKCSNAVYCSRMGKKMEIVLKKSICDNQKEYKSFVNFLSAPKELTGHASFNYFFAEKYKDKVIECLNAVQEELPSQFTFLEFQQVVKNNQLLAYVQNSIDDACTTSMNLKIILVYRFGDYLMKRIIFNSIDFEIK